MIDKRVPDLAAAVAGVRDGMTVLCAGFGMVGEPVALIEALLPLGVRDLVIVSNNAGTREIGIARLIKEGIDVIGPKAVVSCNSRDRDAVASAAGKLSRGPVALTLDPEGLETAGGVVLVTSDGSVRFDNTFEARLERMRPALRKDVAALFGRKR